MRALGYFVNNDTENICLADIENNFYDYCIKFSHQPIKTFIDTSYTKSSSANKFSVMLQYMRDSDGEFLILIPNAKHLGDDLESIGAAITSLNDIKAKVQCMDIDFPDPLQSALHYTGLKGTSKTHSDNVKNAMINKAQDGLSLGRPPYGYKKGSNGKFDLIPKEASIVQMIFNLYTEEYLGLRRIVAYLNEKKIRNRKGKNWNIVTIRDILKNIVYIGTYNRFGFLIPKNHPAIIQKEVFHQARSTLSERRPRRKWGQTEPYMLSGLAICGYCGNKMIGSTKRQTWRRKDRTRTVGIYRYYQCQTRANQSACGYHTWQATALEKEVIKNIGPIQGALLEDTKTPIHTPNNTNQIKSAEKRFVWAFKSTASGQMPISTLASYLKELNKARNSITSSIDIKDINYVLNSFNSWEMLNNSDQHELLNDLIDQIIVKDEGIEVISNYNI